MILVSCVQGHVYYMQVSSFELDGFSCCQITEQENYCVKTSSLPPHTFLTPLQQNEHSEKKTSFFLTNRISSALHHPFLVTPFSGSCKKRFPRPREWLLVSLHVTGNNSQFFWTCWKILRTPTIQDLRLCGEIVCQIFLIGGLP